MSALAEFNTQYDIKTVDFKKFSMDFKLINVGIKCCAEYREYTGKV